MLAILVMALVAPVSAQMKMEFGVKAGVNLANLTGDDADMEEADKKMLLGFGGGAFGRFLLAEGQFCIQPEILYMMKGAKYEGTGDAEDAEAKIKANYICIPILLKYNIPTEGGFKPNVFVGPEFGILMSADITEEYEGEEEEEDIKDYLKSLDLGLTFGAGFDYAVNETGKLTFDARYTMGLSTVDDTFGDDEELTIKNAVISVMVGYAFGMGE